ncbi:MAG: cobalamin biosynthesis protein CobD [Alphaproteobacteria bacterium]|nr:cobalamin biosynthesis protein CobD [Alphaproteobacteria bacterium]
MNSFALAALALVVENLVGYPQALFARIGHPVQWIGKVIAYLDEGLNDPEADNSSQRYQGGFAVFALCLAVGLPTFVVAKILGVVPYGWVINVLLATSLLAQKSLRDHVQAVANALPQSLSTARTELSKIVGRDPQSLDESGIAKAALESLAENTADGITAPLFWYAVAGLPGIAIYKAINTADSMIGHKSEKYLHFGWAAARLDDLVNLPASRLTGLAFAAAAWFTSKADAQNALKAMWRDAGKHLSPNAGWPEAAMAGALGLIFGGPRTYEGESVMLPTMGNGSSNMTVRDIYRGLEIYDRALLILLALTLLGALLL